MDQDSEIDTGTITADDVAAVAGVSRWTVGRAFRKHASISEKSRQKVLAAAQSLGYAPDLLAASLASDRSNLVAFLTDDFENPHTLMVIEGVSRVLHREGWGMLLVNMRGEPDARSALLAASQRRVDAAVLNGTSFDDRVIRTALGAKRVKKLIVFGRISESPNTVSICCDDAASQHENALFAITHGYHSPLFVAGPDTPSAILQRKAAFLSEWQTLRGVRPPFIHVEQYNVALARDRVLAALTDVHLNPRPDILICENDALAIGAVDAIRRDLGLTVPDDIAVVGYDDVPMAALPSYDLTTWRQPITNMAEALIDVLRSEHEIGSDLYFASEFLRRGSA